MNYLIKRIYLYLLYSSILITLSIFITSLFFPYNPQRVQAAIVAGDSSIDGEQYWTKENNPYVIENDFTINKDSILHIGPGVIIEMGNYIEKSFRIDGTLLVEGTENSPVIFTGTSTDTYNRNNSFLEFTELSKNSSIKNAVFKDMGGRGIWVRSNLDIYNVSIKDSNKGLWQDGPASSINAENLSISNTLYMGMEIINGGHFHGKNISIDGVEYEIGLKSSGDSMIEIDGLSMSNVNTSPFIEISGANADIKDMIIKPGNLADPSSIAIYSTFSTLNFSSTTISGFDTAIYSANSDIAISDSTIEENNNGIVSDKMGSYIPSGGIGNLFDFDTRDPSQNRIDISSSSISNKIFNIDNYLNLNNIINAKNNWWGDKAGPVQSKFRGLSGSIEYSPWLDYNPRISKPKDKCCSNVVFIPGFQASRLYAGSNTLWEPNRNADVDKLFLDKDGNSLNSKIYTGDVIDKALGMVPIYDGFIKSMNSLVADKTIKKWKALPYDWRFDISNPINSDISLATTTYNMIEEIKKMASLSDTGKVSIIAHSNGGLIAKKIIKELDSKGISSIVDKLIMIAVPELGTPKAIAGLLYGYDQSIGGGLFLSQDTAKNFGINLMGAYNLLPSIKYFSEVNSPVISGAKNADSFSSMKSFIFDKDFGNPNLNLSMLSKASINHSDLDNYNIPESIKLIKIAGYGINTLKDILIVDKDKRKFENTKMGDGTVVLPSASSGGGQKILFDLSKYSSEVEKGVNHANILNSAIANNSISDLIKGLDLLEIKNKSKYSDYIYLNQNPPLTYLSTNDDLRIGVHSPVELHIYDSQGRHTGKVVNPIKDSDLEYYEENIPNSQIQDMGDNGFYISLDPKQKYTAVIDGTGIGSVTVDMDKTINGIYSSQNFYNDIPVTPLMNAEIKIDPIENNIASTTMFLDINGDNKDDFILKPDKVFDPILYLEILKKNVESLESSKSARKQIIERIDRIISLIKKNKIKQVESRIKKWSKSIEKNRGIHKKMKDTEKEELMKLLNDFLANLEK